MTTYSVRCRHKACRHRRVTTRHPDSYVRPPRCLSCGQCKGWRIESRAYNQRNLCRCGALHYPHRAHHPMCDNHPRGHVNQALRAGATWDDIPLDMLGTPCTTSEAPW